MRKRILACIILTLWLISTLSVTALAFPFNEFKTEDNTLFISDLYDYYTDYEEFIADQGLMLARTIQYKGMGPKGARPMYTQSARLEIALPDGYFDYLKISHKTDPENHWFDCWESDTWYNEYVVNSVYYSLHQDCSVTLHEVEPYGDDRGKSAAELMEKEVDTYRNRKTEQNNPVEDPITIRQERDGYSIILHEQEPTVGKSISFDYDIFDCVIDRWTYVRFMTFSELPGIYVKAVYVMYASKSFEIRDSANKKPCDTYPNGDWEPYYHVALDRISGFLNENMGEKFLDMDSRISITWNEPEIDPSYKGSDQEEDTKQNIGVTQSAEQNPGEDDGVVVSDDIVEGSGKKDSDSDKGNSKSGSVKSSHDYDDDGMGVGGAIAVGVLSTGAAVGAGAAAASSGKGKNNNGKKKKSYKMYVQKDFGDAIRRGAAKPVKIRARMAEVDENGVSRDRNDLTALIGVSGDGMTIHDAALVGRYCEATVSVPENNYNDTANIIFTFNGEGGTFTNTVIFRLVDGPSIKFVEETEKPGEYILNSSRCYIDAIYGDKFTYTAKFMVVDATVMPEVKDITADKINGFDVRFEETDRQYVYKVIIKNKTATLPEKEQSVFAKPTEMTFDFHVKVQGEDKPLEGHVSMGMHNEGITVSSKEIKREALWIDTLPVENSGVSFSDIRPVLFDVLVCYIGKDGAVILKNPEVSFGDINDKGLYGNTFKENFRFKTARLSDGTHGFFPIDTLPQACEPYEALLPITYKGEKKLEVEMPLRLGGEEPTPPSQAEWEKAYEKLKKDIEIFGVDTNDSTTKYLLAHAHEHSAEELAFTRKWIIIAGMHFYAEQSRQYQKIDQTMTRYIIVANSFVKAGDYAVEVLLTIYWGKTAGKITANFVNPLKNMLANYIGQYIGPGSESGTGDYEKMPFFKTILSGTQDALSEAMTGDLKPDPEKLGYIVSAYLMVSFVKHYYEGEDNVKGDIYRSMIAAGGDLTLAKFKAWLSEKISNYSEAMWKKIGQLFGSVIRTYFNGALKEAAENAGKKAFESSIRSAVQSGGVDSLKYATAKLAKEGAKAIQEESSKILLKQYSESLGKEMASGMNTALAFVLNYCFGGTKDENEMLGLSVEDVLQELFFDRFGVYINKVYTAVKNPLDLGIKVSNGILSIEILGYVVEIPLEKNALVVIGLVFDFCFGWMEDLWKIATTAPSSIPDPRDAVTYTTAKLEEGKEILENMPPITYHKKV